MCLSGPALSVEQYAKKVDLKQIAEGKRPVDSVLAWRTWKLDAVLLSPTLKSENQSTLWHPGKPVKAHTTIKKDSAAVGVHAYTTIKDLLAGGYAGTAKSDYRQDTIIVGQVLLWGVIAEHKNGYRAEFGYPFKLYANGPAMQTRLSEIYGCFAARDFIPRLLAEAA